MTISKDTVWEIKSKDGVEHPPTTASMIGNYLTGAQLCDALPGYFSPELEALLRNPPKFNGHYCITAITDDGPVIEGNIP